MSARNFYIMQSAVEPMQSELPCYTPLTNHATDVHVVPMVFASDYKALRVANRRLEAECERLRLLLIDARVALDPFDDKLLEARIDTALSTKP